MPRRFAGVCEAEDCELEFTALACGAVTLRRTDSDAAPVSARMAQGDTVRVTARTLHLLEPGVIRVLRPISVAISREDGHPPVDSLHLAPGDSVLLLYRTLEVSAWWYGGGTYEGAQFWEELRPDDVAAGTRQPLVAAKERSSPKREDWWRIALPNGGDAWWKAENHALLSITELKYGWDGRCPPP